MIYIHSSRKTLYVNCLKKNIIDELDIVQEHLFSQVI